MIADAISADALFGAIITVGLLLSAAALNLIQRSRSNAEGIKRIESKLEDVNLTNMKGQLDELWLDRRETWRYLSQRGDAEALGKGLAKRNSPLSIEGMPREEEFVQLYAPYLPDLIAIDQEVNGGHESMLFEAVAKRLGEKFVKDVCPIAGTDQGGCVSLAIAVLNRYKKKHHGCEC